MSSKYLGVVSAGLHSSTSSPHNLPMTSGVDNVFSFSLFVSLSYATSSLYQHLSQTTLTFLRLSCTCSARTATSRIPPHAFSRPAPRVSAADISSF